LLASGVWQELPEKDWNAWFGGVRHVYDNRGVSKLRSLKDEDAIIDICAGRNDGIYGADSSSQSGQGGSVPPFKWACTSIPKEQSWLAYDVDVHVVRSEQVHVHRVAASLGNALISAVTGGGIGPAFSMEASEQHQIEQQGYPKQRVVLQWKGLRVAHDPEPPILQSIGGRKVSLMKHNNPPKKAVACFGGCTVWLRRSIQVYEVLSGSVGEVKDADYPQDKTLCCQ
jgi:hypothetical protein